MSISPEKVISEALQLSSQDRAVIAERLIASLESNHDQDVEISWQEEIANRIEEMDNGTLQCIPWEDVRTRLKRSQRAHN